MLKKNAFYSNVLFVFFFIAHVISDDLSRDTNEEKLPIAPDL